MRDNKIIRKRIALIGAGSMIEEYVKVLKSLGKVELAGIYSRTKSKSNNLKKKYNIRHVCDSVEELYLKTNADAVIIAVSIESLYEILRDTRKYNWICLSEKPLGYNYNQAAKIFKLFENTKSQLFLALNRRFFSSTLNAQKLLKNVKDKRFIQITDQQNILNKKIPEVVKKNYMYANSIHLIDYINIFCRGKIEAINNIVNIKQSESKYLCKKILFSSGDCVLYTAIWNAPERWSVNINMSMLRLELKPLEELKVQHGNDRKMKLIKINNDDLNFKPGLKNIIKELLKKIDGKSSPLTTLEEGLNLMNLIKRIYE